MPANKKYLTTSPWQRALKISAGFIGGYLVTLSLHLFLMQYVSKKQVYITMNFSTYILWAFLLLGAFIAKSGWKVWGLYLLLSLVFFSPFIYALLAKK